MRELLAMYAMAAIAMDSQPYRPEIKPKLKGENKPQVVPNGLKEFNYKQGIIYALNQKNADRKAKKLNWI